MAKRKRTTGKRELQVLKTYKMYVGGTFPRTESGRYYTPQVDGRSLGNVCLASRKDVRNAVVAARSAQASWSGRSAYNRGQILYRTAEMLEGRRAQFHQELSEQGLDRETAEHEIQGSIDRLVGYAGWADKYQTLFSSVNPVANSHFNFSTLEPTGVVFAIASELSPLLGLVSLIAPIVAGGNTCIVLASESRPLSAVTFGEVVHCSDMPGGVINILTGQWSELSEPIARHMDLNAITIDRDDSERTADTKSFASDSVTRVSVVNRDWHDSASTCPYLIQQFCETKTVWHPIEKISATGSGY